MIYVIINDTAEFMSCKYFYCSYLFEAYNMFFLFLIIFLALYPRYFR